MSDHWGVKLSDLNPTCRASEVLNASTLWLDGIHGTTIHWVDQGPDLLKLPSSNPIMGLWYLGGAVVFSYENCCALLFSVAPGRYVHLWRRGRMATCATLFVRLQYGCVPETNSSSVTLKK